VKDLAAVAAGIDWLEALEEKVRETSERLSDLRVEKRGLEGRVRDLEARLEALSGVAEGTDTLAAGLSAELDRERRDGEALRERVRELEERLAAAEAGSAPHPAIAALEELTREREEVRGRVERLARHLEGLLQDA
jgi:chromosome segregation ATPase